MTLDKIEKSGLGFGASDHHENLFSHYFKGVANRGPGNLFDTISERYVRGELQIALKIATDGRDCEYDVIILPRNVVEETGVLSCWDGVAGYLDVGACVSSATDQSAVFCLIANPVEFPNNMSAPSVACLEAAKERIDVRGEHFRLSTTNKVSCTFRNGEVSDFALVDGKDEGGAVEACPEVRDRIKQNVGEDVRRRLESDLVKFACHSRIYLAHNGVWVTREIGIRLGFKIRDVLVCARESATRAPEWIGIHR